MWWLWVWLEEKVLYYRWNLCGWYGGKEWKLFSGCCGGGGEATENVGASDQVLVDAWARVVTYHNHSQKRTESCQTSIQWHSDT